jgi:hypothetical protein
VSTWERQERRREVGALLPLKARIPSWMHLPALGTSASQTSLEGFDNDGIYDDDDHLPLPEERAAARVYVPADAFECIDASANLWASGEPCAASGGGARGLEGRTHGHPSTDRLDVIAP